jgi:Cu/Ag efflux protein CusF
MNVAHKSIFSVFLTACFIFTGVLPAGSQEATNQGKSFLEVTRDEARQRRAKMPIAKGTIKEIDLLRHQIKLVTEDGPRTFTYTARTYIFRDKDKITADALKVGEIIALRFSTDKDGNVVVLRIKARTPSELMEPPSTGPPPTTNFPAVNSP